MHAIQSNLQQLQDRFNHLVKGYPSKNVLYEKKEVEPIFPINTASLKKAIKLSLAVFVLLLIHLFYGVESSLQSVITVAVILAQPNYGRAEHRGWLRFLGGVIAGGLMGIVGLVILSYVSHFFVLLSYCFVCFFAFGYIALTGERWGYAGLQAAIMLPLILLVANGPVETLTLAGQRFVGVIIGVIIATVIAVLVWPEDPVKHLRQNISSILLDISRWFSRIMNLQRKNSVKVKHKIEAMLHGHEVLVYDTSQVVGETDKSESFFSLAALVNEVYVVINLLEKNLNDEENNQLIKDSLPQFQPIVEQIEAHIFFIGRGAIATNDDEACKAPHRKITRGI